MGTMLDLTCENCGTRYVREKGREGRGRFCSIRCARAAQPMATLAERFWKHVVRTPDGCWGWRGAHKSGPHPYGVLSDGPRGADREVLAHRLSWDLHFGPVPDGMLVCHHCDNPPCTNPAHLFLGTIAMNNRDRDRKGRQGHPVGEATPNARLTEDAVRAIRKRRAEGALLRVIAMEFGVSLPCVHQAITGRNWKHVT